MKYISSELLFIYIYVIWTPKAEDDSTAWEVRRLEAVLSCLNSTLNENGATNVQSQCYAKLNVTCYAMKLDYECSVGFNSAVWSNPVPALVLRSGNVYYNSSSRAILISPEISAEENSLVGNILGLVAEISFRSDSTPQHKHEDGRVSVECIFESPLLSPEQLRGSFCTAFIPEDMHIDETTTVVVSGHFLPPDVTREWEELERLPLASLNAPPNLSDTRRGRVTNSTISRLTALLNSTKSGLPDAEGGHNSWMPNILKFCGDNSWTLVAVATSIAIALVVVMLLLLRSVESTNSRNNGNHFNSNNQEVGTPQMVEAVGLEDENRSEVSSV